MDEPTSTAVDQVPRFCPDCGHADDGSPDGCLCDHCGSALAIQGYCPICEARLRRRVGSLCPKHDVELLADDDGAWSGLAAGSPGIWVTVKLFRDSLAATGARIRLEAEDIATFLEGERMGARAMYRVATGGVKLQVPAEFASEARIIRDQNWSWPDEELGPGSEFADDYTDEHTIEPPTSRRLIVELILVLTLAIPLIAALLAYFRVK